MRSGRWRLPSHRPAFSDVKLPPTPIFVNWLRQYVLKFGLGVESRCSALCWPMGDALQMKLGPSEYHCVLAVLRSNTVTSCLYEKACVRVLQGSTHYW